MKLIFFLINMNLGGTEKSFLNLVDALPKDYEIDLLLLEEKGELLKYLPKNVNVKIIENHKKINEFIKYGCPVFALRELMRGRFVSFYKNAQTYFLYKFNKIQNPYHGILNLIKEQNDEYDYAVAWACPHNFISYYSLNCIKAKKKYQWIHFDIEKIYFDKRFAKNYFPGFDRIFCVSKQVKQNLIQQIPDELKNNTEVYHNIINYKEIRNKSFEYKADYHLDKINILTVGRLTREKGHLEFLTVIEKLKNDDLNFQWTIIGDGKQRKKIEQIVAEKNLNDVVRLLGSKENPYPYFKDCDIYLQPSHYEGHAVTILEAKFFKNPILANHFAGIEDEIQNGYNGIICKPKTDDQYHELKKLILSEELRKQLSLNLKNEIKTEFRNPFL